jgi:hypothetical protein
VFKAGFNHSWGRWLWNLSVNISELTTARYVTSQTV